jgi:hypothetical protein
MKAEPLEPAWKCQKMSKSITPHDRLLQIAKRKQGRKPGSKQQQTQQQVKRQLQVTKDGKPVEGSDAAQDETRLRTSFYFQAAAALNEPGASLTTSLLPSIRCRRGRALAKKI